LVNIKFPNLTSTKRLPRRLHRITDGHSTCGCNGQWGVVVRVLQQRIQYFELGVERITAGQSSIGSFSELWRRRATGERRFEIDLFRSFK